MENKRLFGKICCIQRQMSRQNNVLFSEYGISPVQMHALIFIRRSAKAGESVCQKDVERELNLRPSSVSTLLSNLERDGFITRTMSEGDARAKYLQLTEKGKTICIKDKLLMDECDAAIASALTAEEQVEFDRLLSKLLVGISKN